MRSGDGGQGALKESVGGTSAIKGELCMDMRAVQVAGGGLGILLGGGALQGDGLVTCML